MAKELAHASVGIDLSQSEWESINSHTLVGGVRGDLLYHNGTNIAGLGVGAAGTVLGSNGTDPIWTTSISGVTVTNPTFSGTITANTLATAPTIGSDSFLVSYGGTITEAGSGIHAIVGTLRVSPPTIVDAGASTTSAASVYIPAAPTGATNNYALWVDSGTVQLDSAVNTGSTLTVQGGGLIIQAGGATIQSGGLSIQAGGASITGGLTSIGNIGVKVNPRTEWPAVWTVVDLNNSRGAIAVDNSGATYIAQNAYYDGTTWRNVITSGMGLMALLGNGTFGWYPAASLPGPNQPWTPAQKMLLDSNTLFLTGINLNLQNGNIIFSNLTQRIIADFSTATLLNRFAFQTSVANAATALTVLPNGTSGISELDLYTTADPTISSRIRVIAQAGVAMQINSAAVGGGTVLPIDISVTGGGTIRLHLSGGVSIGDSTDPGVGKVRVVGQMNTYTVPEARVYHNGGQSLTTATPFILAFNNERFDTDTIHDTVTNNSRLTCRTAGKYYIFATAEFQANATGVRYLGIKLNGSIYIAIDRRTASGIAPIDITISTVYDLAVNDYVEIEAYQDAGLALAVTAIGNTSPEFGMVRVG